MIRHIITVLVDASCFFTILLLSHNNYWLIIPCVILSLNAEGGAQ